MNDKAIELETVIYKVRKALERLKNIGLDVEKYEKLTEEIIAECNLETSYTTDNIFQNDFYRNCLFIRYFKIGWSLFRIK